MPTRMLLDWQLLLENPSVGYSHEVVNRRRRIREELLKREAVQK